MSRVSLRRARAAAGKHRAARGLGFGVALAVSGALVASSAGSSSYAQPRAKAKAAAGKKSKRKTAPSRAERAEALVDQARKAVGARDYKSAMKLLRRAMRLTRSPALIAEMAAVLAWAGQLDQSVAWYRRYLRLRPTDDNVRLKLAQTLSWIKDARRQREALALYDAHLTKIPDDGPVRLQRARVRAGLGMVQQAADDFNTYLKALPSKQAVRLELAATLSWSRRRDHQLQALEIYDAHLKKYPKDDQVLLKRARLRSWAGLLEESHADFRAYLARHPENTAVKLEMATVLSWDRKTMRQALPILDEHVAQHPDDKKVFLQRARVRAWLGLTAAAITDLRAYLRQTKSGAVRLELAALLAQSGRLKEAGATYRRAAAEGANRVAVGLGQAQISRRAGRLKQAERALLKLFRRVKSGRLRSQVELELARVFAVTARRELALKLLNEIHQRDPSFKEARDERGRLAEQIGAPAAGPSPR